MKRILGWILKIFLKGIGVDVGDKAVDVEKRKADAAIARNDSIIEAKDLEKDQIKNQDEVKKKFEEEKKARPVSDPLGVDDWNKGK